MMSFEKRNILYLYHQQYEQINISRLLNISLEKVDFFLSKIYNPKNRFYVVRSLSEENIYYFFDTVSEKRIVSNNKSEILNQNNFTFSELKILSELYGFECKLYDGVRY